MILVLFSISCKLRGLVFAGRQMRGKSEKEGRSDDQIPQQGALNKHPRIAPLTICSPVTLIGSLRDEGTTRQSCPYLPIEIITQSTQVNYTSCKHAYKSKFPATSNSGSI